MKQHFDFVVVDDTEILLDGVVCKVVYPLYTNALRKMHKVEQLRLSVRAYNVLKRNGIDTIQQLRVTTLEQIAEARQISLRSLHEIVEAIYFFSHTRV